MTRSRSGVLPTTIVVLTLVYFATGKLGLGLAPEYPSTTTVWPPTGIALAALLVFGTRVWPGVFLGALLVHVTSYGSVAASVGLAVGNTLEGLAGAYLVNRFAGGRRAFDRAQDVFAFALLAGLSSTAISATIGTGSLALGGYAAWAEVGSIWVTWWIRNAASALIVTPLLLLWSADSGVAWNRKQSVEALLLLLGLVGVGLVVFEEAAPFTTQAYPLAFLAVPVLIWAAFRFSPRETATAIFLLAVMAVWGTLKGSGPFATASQHESVLLLRIFLGTAAVMTMALSAGVSERRQGEEALRRAHDELEQTVQERTEALTNANTAMRSEIAERIRLEDTLQRSRAQLSEAQGLTHVGSWDWDIVTGVIAWSDELYRIHGLKPQARRITPDLLFAEHLHPEDRALVQRIIIEQSLKDHRPFSAHHRIVRPDGTVRLVHARGTVVADETGRPVRMHGTAQDVTDLKRAEAALQESEERFKNFMDHSPAVAWTKDEGGRYLYINRTFEHRFSRTLEEIRGKDDLDLWPQETAQVLRMNDQYVLSSGKPLETVEAVPTPDGRNCSWLVYKFMFEDASRNKFVGGIAVDISERKQAEDAVRTLLRISEKLNAALDADRLMDELVMEAIGLVNATSGCGGLRSVEGMVCRRYYRAADVVPFDYCWPPGHGLPGWVLIHHAPYLTNDARADPQMVRALCVEFEVGSAICMPISDVQGEPIGFFEIHNKKEAAGFTPADQALLAAVSQIASIAIQNALAYQQLRGAEQVHVQLLDKLMKVQEEERRRIARELHDETGQSLTSLLIGLRSLEDVPSIDTVRARVVELQRIGTQTLNEVKRLALGLRPSVLDDLGLEAALRRTAGEFARTYKIPVDVYADGFDECRLPSSIESALYRIVQEALTNVAKHAAATSVSVLLRATSSDIRVIIEDNGCGFDVDSVVQSGHTGVHLGLPGMSERAALLNGSVKIESTPGEGTTIYAYIPLQGKG